jgi:hypothetical protein
MMQAAEGGDGDNLAEPLDWPIIRCIFAQG